MYSHVIICARGQCTLWPVLPVVQCTVVSCRERWVSIFEPLHLWTHCVECTDRPGPYIFWVTSLWLTRSGLLLPSFTSRSYLSTSPLFATLASVSTPTHQTTLPPALLAKSPWSGQPVVASGLPSQVRFLLSPHTATCIAISSRDGGENCRQSRKLLLETISNNLRIYLISPRMLASPGVVRLLGPWVVKAGPGNGFITM